MPERGVCVLLMADICPFLPITGQDTMLAYHLVHSHCISYCTRFQDPYHLSGRHTYLLRRVQVAGSSLLGT